MDNASDRYGASYTLQEILTVKSDDVVGRVKAYEAIVKGQNIPEPGVPESFKVLIKELQSIGLDIRVLSGDAKEIIIKDDEDDEAAVRKKADDMGVEVGAYGDHEVKPPAPAEPPPEDMIAEDMEPPELTEEEIDEQLKTVGDLEEAANENLSLDTMDIADTPNEVDPFTDDLDSITRYTKEEEDKICYTHALCILCVSDSLRQIKYEIGRTKKAQRPKQATKGRRTPKER